MLLNPIHMYKTGHYNELNKSYRNTQVRSGLKTSDGDTIHTTTTTQVLIVPDISDSAERSLGFTSMSFSFTRVILSGANIVAQPCLFKIL